MRFAQGLPCATRDCLAGAVCPVPQDARAVCQGRQDGDGATEDSPGLANEVRGHVPKAGQQGQEPTGGQHVGDQEELEDGVFLRDGSTGTAM